MIPTTRLYHNEDIHTPQEALVLHLLALKQEQSHQRSLDPDSPDMLDPSIERVSKMVAEVDAAIAALIEGWKASEDPEVLSIACSLEDRDYSSLAV